MWCLARMPDGTSIIQRCIVASGARLVTIEGSRLPLPYLELRARVRLLRACTLERNGKARKAHSTLLSIQRTCADGH